MRLPLLSDPSIACLVIFPPLILKLLPVIKRVCLPLRELLDLKESVSPLATVRQCDQGSKWYMVMDVFRVQM